MQLHDVKLEKAHEHILDDSSSDDVRDVPYTRYSRTPAGLSPGDRGRTSSGLSSGMQPRSTTPPKIDKRLHQHFVSRLFCFTVGVRWEVLWKRVWGWGVGFFYTPLIYGVQNKVPRQNKVRAWVILESCVLVSSGFLLGWDLLNGWTFCN